MADTCNCRLLPAKMPAFVEGPLRSGSQGGSDARGSHRRCSVCASFAAIDPARELAGNCGRGENESSSKGIERDILRPDAIPRTGKIIFTAPGTNRPLTC